jgi:sugar lactone lactonase YvrE
MQKGRFIESGELTQPGDYRVLFKWGYLEWLLDDKRQIDEYYKNESYKGAMPAGFKIDSSGNYYLSVPRWHEGIPSSFNKIVVKDGKALLEPYPNIEMNKEGDSEAIQSVLGFEIDENDVLWILDQGHVCDRPSGHGSQKIVKWDIRSNKLIDVIIIPDEIAAYNASFLNDICVDNRSGYAYIADSGIYTDPLQGGLIVVNTHTNELRRVLHQHVSTQDAADFWFEINGVKIWKDVPMRTGADGITLSADKETLYWCPLTGRDLYSAPTASLRDFSISQETIGKAVVNRGDKGTNTDGMTGDSEGRVWYTMLEGMGIGYYDPGTDTMKEFVSDDRMVWVDTPQFDGRGNILFDSNQLHFLNKGELDYSRDDNLVIWQAYVGADVKSYLFPR